MDLLKLMLEKDPEKRVSSANALNHPAFHSVLSKSPLVMKNMFNADALIKHQKLVEELFNQQKLEESRSIHEPNSENPG